MFTQRVKSSKSRTECWQAHCENGPQTTGTLFSSSLLLYFFSWCSYCIYLLSEWRQGLLGGPPEEPGGKRGLTLGSVTQGLVSSGAKVKAAHKAPCWFSEWRFMGLICSFSACRASLLVASREPSHPAGPWSTLATAPAGSYFPKMDQRRAEDRH